MPYVLPDCFRRPLQALRAVGRKLGGCLVGASNDEETALVSR